MEEGGAGNQGEEERKQSRLKPHKPSEPRVTGAGRLSRPRASEGGTESVEEEEGLGGKSKGKKKGKKKKKRSKKKMQQEEEDQGAPAFNTVPIPKGAKVV